MENDMQFSIALISICPKLYDIDLLIFLVECVYRYYKIIKKKKEGHEVIFFVSVRLMYTFCHKYYTFHQKELTLTFFHI